MRDGLWYGLLCVVVIVSIFTAGRWWESKQEMRKELARYKDQWGEYFDKYQQVCINYRHALDDIEERITAGKVPCSNHRWHEHYCWKGTLKSMWFCCDCGLLTAKTPLGWAYYKGKRIHEIPVHEWKLIVPASNEWPEDFDWDEGNEKHGPFFVEYIP